MRFKRQSTIDCMIDKWLSSYLMLLKNALLWKDGMFYFSKNFFIDALTEFATPKFPYFTATARNFLWWKSFQNCSLLEGFGKGFLKDGCILSSILVFSQINPFFTFSKSSSPRSLLIKTREPPLLSLNPGAAFSMPQ